MASQTMKVLVHQADKTAGIKEVQIPALDDRDVLIRTVAAALNPTDWKSLKYRTNPGNVGGCDFAGEVVRVGKATSILAVGDRVAGFIPGSVWKDRGGFAEYIPMSEDLVWKVPENITMAEASTFGCAFWTAVQGLFHPARLGLVEPPEKVSRETWVFVYGGSSSVGQFAIQLLHAAGYRVVTVSSKHNFDLCRSLGADAVFDYHNPEVLDQVKAVTGDTLHHAIDCISTGEAQCGAVGALAPGPGKVMIVLETNPIATILRPDVEVQPIIVYTATGQEFAFYGAPVPPIPADRAHSVQFIAKVPGLVRAGLLKPNPVQLLPGGLERVPEGLRLLEEGKVSGKKLVTLL